MQLIYSDAGNEGEGSNLVVLSHLEWQAVQQWLRTASGGSFAEWYSEYRSRLATLAIDAPLLAALERIIQSPGTAFRDESGRLIDFDTWQTELYNGAADAAAVDVISKLAGSWIRGLDSSERRQLLDTALGQN